VYRFPIKINKITIFFLMLAIAMVGFELFNYDTTRYALEHFMPGHDIFGMTWPSLLAISACLVDFAGIASIIAPERGPEEPVYVWGVFVAWVLAAILNAALTWWGTLLAMLARPDLGNEVVSRTMLLQAVPLGVALLVLLIRVSLIGTIMAAGDKFLSAPKVAKTKEFSKPLPPLKRPIPGYFPAGKPNHLKF